MGEPHETQGPAYRAFISYSHQDLTVAAWLQRRLEFYRLPRRLVGQVGPFGPVPARLAPIFRDLPDLPAADSLSAAVQAALAQSQTLIVLCSPAAAASPWVAREIALFRQLHPGRPVLAALVDGDPASAFPTCLTADGAEPLAADLSGRGEARRLGFLKLVAGIAGVPLDALVQRDAQRRIARVTAVTLAALIAVLILTAMTIYALRARNEAERQRAAAEGLVEFMLTDLREQLRGVGRLDVLAAANARALKHYAGQDLARLPAAALERRARLLHAIGEDEQEAGKTAAARRHFTEAKRTTATLLARQPNDPDRIFAHAQSEFWLAQLDLEARDLAAAEAGFMAYDRLATRLLALAPAAPRSLQEAGYAAGNLCTLWLEQGRREGLVAQCKRSLDRMIEAARRLPGNAAAQRDVANRHADLADAYRLGGDLDLAVAQRQQQSALLARLLRSDPRSARLERARIWSQRALAKLEAQMGEAKAAVVRMTAVRAALARLVALDRTNNKLAAEVTEIDAEITEISARRAKQ